MSTMERTRCYTDNSTEQDVPNNEIKMPCKHTARYVIVETRYDAPDDNRTGAILEICEIEVYGMVLSTITFFKNSGYRVFMKII